MQFSPVSTDFDKCHNLSKRNVKLILKILSDLELLGGRRIKQRWRSSGSFVAIRPGEEPHLVSAGAHFQVRSMTM
jgi:hypothetical protein